MLAKARHSLDQSFNWSHFQKKIVNSLNSSWQSFSIFHGVLLNFTFQETVQASTQQGVQWQQIVWHSFFARKHCLVTPSLGKTIPRGYCYDRYGAIRIRESGAMAERYKTFGLRSMCPGRATFICHLFARVVLRQKMGLKHNIKFISIWI